MLACAGGSIELARMLLGNGADPDIENGNGMNAFILSVMNNNLELVKLLLDRGYPSRQRVRTLKAALADAAGPYAADMRKLLLKAGAAR